MRPVHSVLAINIEFNICAFSEPADRFGVVLGDLSGLGVHVPEFQSFHVFCSFLLKISSRFLATVSPSKQLPTYTQLPSFNANVM